MPPTVTPEQLATLQQKVADLATAEKAADDASTAANQAASELVTAQQTANDAAIAEATADAASGAALQDLVTFVDGLVGTPTPMPATVRPATAPPVTK